MIKMKNKKISIMIVIMVLLFVLPVFSQDLDCTLSIQKINLSETEKVESYNLNCPEIIYGLNETTENIYIIMSEEFSGIYVEDTNEDYPVLLKSIEGLVQEQNEEGEEYTAISLNDIIYMFYYLDINQEFLNNSVMPEEFSLDIEETPFLMLVSTKANSFISDPRYDTIKIDNDEGYILLFFDTDEIFEQIIILLNIDEENDSLSAAKNIDEELLISFIGEEIDTESFEELKEELEKGMSEKMGAKSDIFSDDEDILECINTDEDEEDPYSVFGYAQGKIAEASQKVIVLQDFCAGPILHEAICKDNKVRYEIVECDGVCQGGACVTEENDETGTDFCISLDDPFSNVLSLTRGLTELNYNKFHQIVSRQSVTIGGYAAGTTIGINDLWNDYCADNNTLIEYTCDSNRVRFTKIICPSGCEEGKCEEGPYCWESDGGKNIEYKGFTYVYSNSDTLDEYEDVCINETTLREYYCMKDNLEDAYGYEDIICDYGCTGGKCKTEEMIECEDDEDCPEGETCLNNICEVMCNESTDCPEIQEGETKGCIEGICQDCESNDDCADGWLCEEGRCVKVECASHLSCAINEECIDFECQAETINNFEELKNAIWRRIERLRILEDIIRQMATNKNFEPWCDYDGRCEFGETEENCPTDCGTIPRVFVGQELEAKYLDQSLVINESDRPSTSQILQDTEHVIPTDLVPQPTIFQRIFNF